MDRDLALDLVALALVVAGLVGLVVVAFRVDPNLGWALLCVLTVVSGGLLGMRGGGLSA